MNESALDFEVALGQVEKALDAQMREVDKQAVLTASPKLEHVACV